MIDAALLVVLLCTVLGVTVAAAHWRRRQVLSRLAGRLGLRFVAADTKSLLERLGLFYLFRLGHSRRVVNVVEGHRQGRAVLAFDYRYELGSGPGRELVELTVLVVQLRLEQVTPPATAARPGCPAAGGGLPHVVARRRDDFRGLGRFADFEEIDWPDNPLQSRWRLHGCRADHARQFLTRPLAGAFRAMADVDWEFADRYLVVYAPELLGPVATAKLLAGVFRCCRALERHGAGAAPLSPGSGRPSGSGGGT